MNETKSLRQFGLVMAAGFALIGIVIPLIRHQIVYPVLSLLTVIFLLLALLAPRWLSNVRAWWMKLGDVMGHINSTILFTVIYLTLFSGIHFLFRLMGRDRFKRKWKAYGSTYTTKESISDFKDPF